MSTIQELIVAASTSPDGSTISTHLNNLNTIITLGPASVGDEVTVVIEEPEDVLVVTESSVEVIVEVDTSEVIVEIENPEVAVGVEPQVESEVVIECQ